MFCLMLIVVSTAFSQQGVHKCTNPDGKVTYQPSPCTSGTGTVLIQGKPKPPDPMDVFKIDHEKMENEVRNNLALFEKAQKSLGMSEEEFLKGRRPPDKINTTVIRGMKREQWIYRQGYGTEYYYFVNGKLDAVQN